MADGLEETVNSTRPNKIKKGKKSKNSKTKNSLCLTRTSNPTPKNEEKINEITEASKSCSTRDKKLEPDLTKCIKQFVQFGVSSPPSTGDLICKQCDIRFSDKMDYQKHMELARHKTTVKLQEELRWQFRPPPRGLMSFEYSICQAFLDKNSCRLGDRCIEAHGMEEMKEWKERFSHQSSKIEKDASREMGNTEKLIQELNCSSDNSKILSEKIDGLTCVLNSNLFMNLSNKPSEHTWIFHIKYPYTLNSVCLLYDSHRSSFSLKKVSFIENNPVTHTRKTNIIAVQPSENQEWVSNFPVKDPLHIEYKIEICFQTEIYGTFRQDVIFDFGIRPVFKQSLCVNCISKDVKCTEDQHNLIISRTVLWCKENCNIIHFEPKVDVDSMSQRLLEKYPIPNNETFKIAEAALDKVGSKSTYRERMHNLLSVEEIEHFNLISQFNIRTPLLLTEKYCIYAPTASVVKYAIDGERFGRLVLSSEISEDSPHGRLIINCNAVLLSLDKSTNEHIKNGRRIAYEALIEDKTKNEIYIRLSSRTVEELKLQDEEEITFDIQFQLNRLPICEMHEGLSKFSALNILYPSISDSLSIPWNPAKNWHGLQDLKLNPKQKEALLAISAPQDVQLPPILLIGPFGTGKTYTLGQTIKYLVQQSKTARILVCTHSNSAADIYIKDYLHPHIGDEELEDTKPLRIYYHKRWVNTVDKIVQKYCLVVRDENSHCFRQPTKADIYSHRIIVTTINTSMVLLNLDIPKDYFTHILIDEAAQIIESASLVPLALANSKTRIVLAGDYMQLSQEVFSTFCKERGLHISLLERLFDMYLPDFACRIMLVENYRSHSAIIQFTSNLFYEKKLVSREKISAHPIFHPLSFFTAKGEDAQDPNSISFHNNAEVSEVYELVDKLVETWPTYIWGPFNENSIGIVTPYMDQVMRIRFKMRQKKGLSKISVERVLNVQGKEYRVIILSTVRTRNTCPENDSGLDFGFLSNAKLLTTAITRARSMVAVVGDPISLCSIGKCRKIWEEFLLECAQASSLNGITWSEIRSQLDGIELQKIYGLNPNAKEFVPRYNIYPQVFPIISPIVNPHLGPVVYPGQNVIPPLILPYNAPFLMPPQIPVIPPPGMTQPPVYSPQVPYMCSPPMGFPPMGIGYPINRLYPVQMNPHIGQNYLPLSNSYTNPLYRHNPIQTSNIQASPNLSKFAGPPLVENQNLHMGAAQNIPSKVNPLFLEQQYHHSSNDKIKFLNNVHFPNSTIISENQSSNTEPSPPIVALDNCSSKEISIISAHCNPNPQKLYEQRKPKNESQQIVQSPSENYLQHTIKKKQIASVLKVEPQVEHPNIYPNSQLGHDIHQESELIESLSKILNDSSSNKENSTFSSKVKSYSDRKIALDYSDLGLECTLFSKTSNDSIRNTSESRIDQFCHVSSNVDNVPLSQSSFSKYLMQSNASKDYLLQKEHSQAFEPLLWKSSNQANTNQVTGASNTSQDFNGKLENFSMGNINIFDFSTSLSSSSVSLPLYLRKGAQSQAVTESSKREETYNYTDASSGWSQETKARLPHH